MNRGQVQAVGHIRRILLVLTIHKQAAPSGRSFLEEQGGFPDKGEGQCAAPHASLLFPKFTNSFHHSASQA